LEADSASVPNPGPTLTGPALIGLRAQISSLQAKTNQAFTACHICSILCSDATSSFQGHHQIAGYAGYFDESRLSVAKARKHFGLQKGRARFNRKNLASCVFFTVSALPDSAMCRPRDEGATFDALVAGCFERH